MEPESNGGFDEVVHSAFSFLKSILSISLGELLE